MKPFFLIRVLVAAAGIGTTIGVSLVVSSSGGDAVVRVLNWAGPNYAQDIRGFRPVARSLLADLSVTPRRAAPASVARASPRATTGEVPSSRPAPSPAPSSSTSPPPADPLPSVAIAMSADVSTTHPNDVYWYTIRISNTGAGAAKGLVVHSHVPDGTSLSGWECDGVRVKASGRGSFGCGTTATATHPVAFGMSSLAPGADATFRFSVKVDKGVHHNTAITNHAHAYAENADLIDSEQVTVVV